MVNSAGEAYWFFSNAFGRDSYDGFGAQMITVNNDPRIDCPNANWNSVTTNYCDGVTSDDVVSHEWGHAYTEYTDGLIYQWQPGALNESYSDIWGETLDLINGREDEGEGDIDVKRAVGSCDPHGRPAPDHDDHRPGRRGRSVHRLPAAFGPAFTTTPVTATIVVATDAANRRRVRPRPTAARRTPTQRGRRQVGIVDRGTCPFTTKHANAVGCRRDRHRRRQQPAGPPALDVRPANIYGVMVSQADRTRIKNAGGPVTATSRPRTSPRARRPYPLADRREVAGLRRRDPRHVEPDLLPGPGQGDRRGVQLRLRDDRQRRRARQLRGAQPRLRPARRRWQLQRPDGARHRPHEGGGDLLAGPERLPELRLRLRRPRGRADPVLPGPDRGEDQRAEHGDERQPGLAQDDQRRRLRPGAEDGGGCGAVQGPAGPVQLPARAGAGRPGSVRCRLRVDAVLRGRLRGGRHGQRLDAGVGEPLQRHHPRLGDQRPRHPGRTPPRWRTVRHRRSGLRGVDPRASKAPTT